MEESMVEETASYVLVEKSINKSWIEIKAVC